MPWSNNTGGPWGSGGGNRGGPWGGSPQGGGSSSPDLEEILKRGQERLRTAIPGGGGGNRLLVLLVVLGLVVVWLFNAFYRVEPDELGIELLFGDPKNAVSEPGLHFHLWPVETVEIVNTRQRRELIGDAGRTRNNESLMLSGDQNIVDVVFTVIWNVSEPAKYLFNVAEPPEFVRRVSESAMREVVGRSRADDVRTDQRAEVEEAVLNLVQATLNGYQAGINVIGVQLERADPPEDVADAFEEVQRAQQDQARFQLDARAYANKRLGEARGEAAQATEQALAYKNRVVAEAKGEAERFISVYDEYAKAKDVTRTRLFLETMERVLRDSNKVILENDTTSGVVPYLPLPEIQGRRTQGETAQ